MKADDIKLIHLCHLCNCMQKHFLVPYLSIQMVTRFNMCLYNERLLILTKNFSVLLKYLIQRFRIYKHS